MSTVQPPPPPEGEQPPPPPTYPAAPPPPPPGGEVYPPAPPPPPGGGYGAPPPPGGGGFGAPPGYEQPYTVGEAFNYGWRKFQAHLGPIILAALAYIVVIAIVELIFFFVIGGIASSSTECTRNPATGALENCETSGGGLFATLLLAGIFAAVAVVLAAVMQAGIARGVLGITYGRPIDVGTMFKFENIGTVIVAGLIVAVAAGIGFILCIVPGIIVIFFSQFYVWFIVDKQMGAWDAIKASFALINQNIGTLVVFYLASIVAYAVGAILCGVGLLAAIPVIYIAQGYTYRRLQGEAVAP